MLTRLAEHLDSKNLLLKRIKEYDLADSFLCTPVVEDFKGRRGLLRGRETTFFSLADYLGLDQHPEIVATAREAIERYGMHFGSSRIYLDFAPYRELEKELASFVGADSALVFTTTTLTHQGVIGALASPDLLLVVDLYAHRSIAEAASLARGKGAEVCYVPHDRPEALDAKLRRNGHRFKHAVVAVDGIYSMTGRHHDLAEYQRICRKHDAVLYVDDAHGFGVCGQGRGIAAQFDLSWDNLLYVGGMAKAVSSLGAFVAGKAELVERLRMTAPTQIFSGPLPIPNIFTARKALSMLREEPERGLVAALWARTRQAGALLQEAGLMEHAPQSPILIVPVPNNDELLAVTWFCLDQGVHFNIATYPAVPKGLGGLRIVINGVHTREDVLRLADALRRSRQMQGVA
ncbi:MAG: pyridoxal phosphate-dependent aminotransferase family protein [Planctomycetes bacterium]|nr:pyridoxal phosphate-dependent aminotransferase family protein [Planctomycetota bacterium]